MPEALAPVAPTAIRGPALTFTGDPFVEGVAATMRFEGDAIVAMAGGKINHFGPASTVKSLLPAGTHIYEYGRDALILPGFIDCHVHYPQTQIIGAYGEQLLDWLEKYTFVAEQQFADVAHARAVANVFLDECLRNGTTTVASFCTVHAHSVDTFFEAAAERGMRTIAGKCLMDRNAPEALRDTAQRGYDQSKALIERWHGKGRASYAITPRFAPTSTPEQMELAGALWKEHPGTYLQSHVSENRDEVAYARSIYPERAGYLDIYDHYGQLGPRAIYGHGIWLTDSELARMHESGTAIAHCPTSNMFLGSGLFDLSKAKQKDRPVRVGLATDVGAGTTLSMLRTMGAAYQVAQLGGGSLSAPLAFYLATRSAAQALYLEDKIGSLELGMEADLIVLNMKSTPLIEFRMQRCESFEEALFVQMTMADERAIAACYVNGRQIPHGE
ncbi:MAG TPA: guanine deaminase [Steroidobacteraceae bacterium]|nr:guanine deaminase [Steroidobacteraceae bacterium]